MTEPHGTPEAPRYRRNLGALGSDGQARLLAGHAVVVGLGGLGGHVLDQLARCGLGRITGVDPDVFDETNLNRQLLATVAALGRRKVDVAQECVAAVNPACVFVPLLGRHRDVPEAVWAGADVVFDCLDSISDRLDLAAVCARAGRPLVHGAVAGWYGQIAVAWPGLDVMPALYPRAEPGWERELGCPPFTVAATASLMVAHGVRIVAGLPIPRERRVEFIDLRENRWRSTLL
jgi:molybdopterin/thiamine biosynthesis adenylyltransferase